MACVDIDIGVYKINIEAVGSFLPESLLLGVNDLPALPLLDAKQEASSALGSPMI